MLTNAQKKLFWISFLGGLCAVLAHAYLTSHHIEFRYGEGASQGLCSLSSSINCEQTSASTYSEVFGVPIALFGGIVNFIFICLLFAYRYPVVSTSTQYALTTSLKLLSLAIFVTSLIMGSISIFALQTLCPVCTLTYFLSFVTFLATWKMTPGNLGFSMFEVKLIPSLAAITLVSGLLISHNLKKNHIDEEQNEFLKVQLQDWSNKQAQSVTANAPIAQGPSDSKMVLVEFADYLCGHCATAFPTLHTFLKKHPDVRFEFQAFPLDGACNSAIPQSEGTRCYLAQVVQCSHEMGADPWFFQEYIFKNQTSLLSKSEAQNRLKELSQTAGFDYEKLNECANAANSLETIKAQAEVGNQLGISGTPTLYVNGKKVQGLITVPLLESIHRKLSKD